MPESPANGKRSQLLERSAATPAMNSFQGRQGAVPSSPVPGLYHTPDPTSELSFRRAGPPDLMIVPPGNTPGAEEMVFLLIYSTAFVWRGPSHVNDRLRQAQLHLILAPRLPGEGRQSSGGRLGWGPPVCVETSPHPSMETADVWGTPHCHGLHFPSGNLPLCRSRLGFSSSPHPPSRGQVSERGTMAIQLSRLMTAQDAA